MGILWLTVQVLILTTDGNHNNFTFGLGNQFLDNTVRNSV